MPVNVPLGYKQALYLVNEKLHERAIKRAAKDGVTLSVVVNEALKNYLSAKAPAKRSNNKEG